MTNETQKVRHRGTAAEPWATEHAYGVIARTPEGHLRVTPRRRGVPSMAYVSWGEGLDAFSTWERLSDLTIIKERKR